MIDEIDRRLDEMRRLARALSAGLRDTRELPIERWYRDIRLLRDRDRYGRRSRLIG